ncbi:MAG: hypothetical protein WCS90_04500 [Bacilli bacterium]
MPSAALSPFFTALGYPPLPRNRFWSMAFGPEHSEAKGGWCPFGDFGVDQIILSRKDCSFFKGFGLFFSTLNAALSSAKAALGETFFYILLGQSSPKWKKTLPM